MVEDCREYRKVGEDLKMVGEDNKGRKILWGWINESDSVADDITKGWASLQGIPRVVKLDSSSRSSLIQWPVSEVEALRGTSVTKHNVVLKRGSVMKIDGLNSGAAQVDVEVEFKLDNKLEDHVYEIVEDMDVFSNAQKLCSRGKNVEGTQGFGLMVLASDDLRERSVVSFRFFKQKSDDRLRKVVLCVDQSRSSLDTDVDKTSYGGFVNLSPHQKSLSLRVLVDHSIIESFAERGKTCITSRSYPMLAVNENASLFVFNNGDSNVIIHSLTAWHMKEARQQYSSIL